MKAERGKMAINEKQEGHYSEKQYLELLVHDSWSSSSCVSKTSSNLSLTVVLFLILAHHHPSPFRRCCRLCSKYTNNSHHTFIHPPPSYNTISPFCPSFPPHLYKYFNLSPISFIKHTLTLFFFFLSFITLIRRLRSSRFSNRTARGPLSASLTFPTFSLYVSIFLPLSLPLQNKSLYYNPLFRSLCISITSLSLRIISYLSSLARTHTHTHTRTPLCILLRLCFESTTTSPDISVYLAFFFFLFSFWVPSIPRFFF